jgi:hypothetical protein
MGGSGGKIILKGSRPFFEKRESDFPLSGVLTVGHASRINQSKIHSTKLTYQRESVRSPAAFSWMTDCET